MFSFKRQIERRTKVSVDEDLNQRMKEAEDRINAKLANVGTLSDRISRASEAVVEALTREEPNEHRQLMARR